MAAQLPLINGVSYAWADISLNLFGTIVKGITDISYSKTQKKENNYGWGDEPDNRGYGNKEYSASITLYRKEWLRIIALSPFSDPLDVPPFEIPIVFGSARNLAQTDILNACEFMEDAFKASQGETKLLVTIPLIIAGVQHII